MPFCAPYMVHLVGWGNVFLCHQGHTGALAPVARLHLDRPRSYDLCKLHVAKNPCPLNSSKTSDNSYGAWNG